MEEIIIHIISILPYIIWFLGILYCRKVAMRLNMNGSNAILAGIFLPVLSWIIYFVYSFRNKTKEARTKTFKIISSIAIFLILLFIGTFYYISGTPEYSLFKLKRAIIKNKRTEIEKYFDVENIAKKYNESPSQFLEESLSKMNASFLEIKEENPDKSKEASVYVSTGLTGKQLKSASVIFSSQNSNPLIALEFNSEGTKLFSEITKRNVGKNLALFLGGNIMASPSVQNEVSDGKISISSNSDLDQIKTFVKRINEEKNGMVSGLKIKEKSVDRDSAKITVGILGEVGKGTAMELKMAKMAGDYWRVEQVNFVPNADKIRFPAPEGSKSVVFDWKYKGKSYSLDEILYDSYYKYYNSLSAGAIFNGESAVGWEEKNNEVFLTEANEDELIMKVAQSIKAVGDENNLNDNQIAELVSTFVQTIPYDTDKFNNREAGLRGISEKATYPYEVLYINKGVCQDKSYLAYLLLKDLGYGVSIFIFPEDQHMAIGLKCPMEYSQYDSGYCFLETTSLENKIGVIPELLPQSNIASSNIEIDSYADDKAESAANPLGKVEVINKIDGKEYTGILDTIATQKEINGLKLSIDKQYSEIKGLKAGLTDEGNNFDSLDKKLKSLRKSGNINDYNDLVPKYNSALSKLKKGIAAYDAKIATYNQIIGKYNALIKNFYQ